MIYVNGTELTTAQDYYINSSSTANITPNYVYCNGTLIWSKPLSTSYFLEYASGSISYPGQPGKSTQSKSISYGTADVVQIPMGKQGVITTNTLYCYYPQNYTSVSPYNWNSASNSFFGLMTYTGTPTFTINVDAGDTYISDWIVYRGKPYLTSKSSNISSFVIYDLTGDSSYTVPASTSASTTWRKLPSSSSAKVYGCGVGTSDSAKQYYWKWTYNNKYSYYWICTSSNFNRAARSFQSINMTPVSSNSPYIQFGSVSTVSIQYLTLKSNGGTSYTITNNLPFEVTVEYNTKKCNWDDGYNWTGLSNISSFTLGANSSRSVTISSNWFADAETCSIKAPNGYRYISCLGSDGYLSTQAKTY